MADEFGQRIIGIFSEGDTIVSTDKHPAVFGKKASDSTYQYLKIDDNGGLVVGDGGNDLSVNVSNTSIAVSGTVTANTNYEYAEDSAHNDGDIGAFTLAVRNDAGTPLAGDGDYIPLTTDASGNLRVAGTLNITASNSVYHAGSATLVKDTIGVVVSRTTAADEEFTGLMVSGAGYCEWQLEVQAAVILKWWTTPSHPTEYVDLPDFLKVTTGQVIRIQGTNREKAASTGSDFTGYATLIRKA